MKHTNKSAKRFTHWAAITVLAASLLPVGLFTACPNAAGGGGTSSGSNSGGGTITPDAAILTLDPANKTIKITVGTSDGSAVTVEGADKTSVNSGEETELTATGDKITLKSGKITELACWNNKLTALDVRGLSLLQELACHANQLTALNVDNVTELKNLFCALNKLDAAAFTALLNGLPARAEIDDASCILFSELPLVPEQNYKFEAPVPADLKEAFKKARDTKHWKLLKVCGEEDFQDIVLP
ncbi:leucine-rich repeat domain-containing protein [Treponema sp. OMZ 840]|uniref:leucine-rich repeat domain-containing protein n=1 Tax=Treponema sp. OMZ 840 TaxID=244313 RepID=UPI003D8FBB5B